MATPEKHALLSASSASRWLNCTAAPRFEERFPESTSEYAEEGRLAHSICELKLLKTFTSQISPRAFKTRYSKLKKDPLYQDEMDDTSEFYIDHLCETAMHYDEAPYVAAEVQVDFGDYVPDGFGTCDCVMIGGDTLHITDYKHGKGVEVSAVSNPQMRLYALGALKRYAPLYGDRIKHVCTTIIQPRITKTPSDETLTVDELKAWGETVKAPARKAFLGLGEFLPGEHCRFCRGKAVCRARARQNMSLEQSAVGFDVHKASDAIDLDEIADLLRRGRFIADWYRDLESYAKRAIVDGARIPGLKVVAGKSRRFFSNVHAAMQIARDAGYEESMLYERTPISLASLEKLMGEKEFTEKLAAYVVKPLGAPTLVPDTDSRPDYNSALADFAGVGNTQTENTN